MPVWLNDHHGVEGKSVQFGVWKSALFARKLISPGSTVCPSGVMWLMVHARLGDARSLACAIKLGRRPRLIHFLLRFSILPEVVVVVVVVVVIAVVSRAIPAVLTRAGNGPGTATDSVTFPRSCCQIQQFSQTKGPPTIMAPPPIRRIYLMDLQYYY